MGGDGHGRAAEPCEERLWRVALSAVFGVPGYASVCVAGRYRWPRDSAYFTAYRLSRRM
jgi:hypothetical protein